MSEYMQLRAKVVPYSSVVGSSVTLIDENGRARFMVLACGTTEGITKEESESLVGGISDLINNHGIYVPTRMIPQ